MKIPIRFHNVLLQAANKTNLTTKTQRDLNSFLCALCAFVVRKNLLKKASILGIDAFREIRLQVKL